MIRELWKEAQWVEKRCPNGLAIAQEYRTPGSLLPEYVDVLKVIII